jgi:hypothetical protein
LAASVLLTLAVGGGTAWYLRQRHLDEVAAEARREAEQARQDAGRAREVDGYLATAAEHRRAGAVGFGVGGPGARRRPAG